MICTKPTSTLRAKLKSIHMSYKSLFKSHFNCLNFRKAVIMFAFILVNQHIVFSQDYKKMILEDASWRVTYNEKAWPDTTLYEDVWEYRFDGDTTINNTIYTKLYRNTLYSINNNYSEPYAYTGEKVLAAVLREDTISRLVHGMYIEESTANCQGLQDVLLYDFSKQVNDSINQCNIHFNRYDIDIISPDQQYPEYNSYYHLNIANEPLKLFTEAIGAPSGPIGWVGWVEDAEFIMEKYCVGSMEDCGVVSSVSEIHLSDVSAYPNPFNEKLIISSNTKISSVLVYDIFGKEVKFNFNPTTYEIEVFAPAGVYFVSLTSSSNQSSSIRITKI